MAEYFTHKKTEGHQAAFQEWKLKNKQNIWTEKPLVISSMIEHHANIIPWREAGAQVIQIGFDEIGQVNYKELEQTLQKYKN